MRFARSSSSFNPWGLCQLQRIAIISLLRLSWTEANGTCGQDFGIHHGQAEALAWTSCISCQSCHLNTQPLLPPACFITGSIFLSSPVLSFPPLYPFALLSFPFLSFLLVSPPVSFCPLLFFYFLLFCLSFLTPLSPCGC